MQISAHLKTAVLMILLFFESLGLTSLILKFTISKHYFTLDINPLLQMGALLLLIAYTYSLTIGAWNKYHQFLIVPIPLAAGIAAITLEISPIYAAILFFATLFMGVYHLTYATRLKDMFIRFHPNLIFKHTTRGILFAYALVAAAFVLMNPKISEDLDIPGTIAKLTNQHLETKLQDSGNGALINSAGLLGIDVQGMVENEVSKSIEPFKNFFLPVIALLVMGLIQFVNFFVLLIYGLTIGIVFTLAKAAKLLKVDYVDVKQEVLKF